MPAAFIQALTFELIHGHGIVLLFRGWIYPVFELNVLNDHLLKVERNINAVCSLC